MKSLVYKEFGEPSVLTIEEMPKPQIKENEILVKVEASGINPVDTYFRKGIRKVESFPHIPHFDMAGTVIELGSEVTTHQIGERIWASNAKGASGEYVAIDSSIAFPLNELPFTHGAAIAMPFLTAHLALFFRGELKEYDTVLIYGGSGAVGHAAIQLAKLKGSTVITTASTKEKEKIAKAAGADYVINYVQSNVEEAIKKITNNQGVSLILDMSLSENMEADLNLIKNGGKIITIGSPKNNTPPLLWRLLNQKNAALLGLLLFTVPKDEYIKAGKEISESISEGLIEAHQIEAFKLEEASTAHQALEAQQILGRAILIHS
ncbi:putative quinone oxidoreductase [Bacillus sp. TS-2]|nr:putative quinone oxidoreductase [Bacillus sp. TS-2]